MEIGHRSIVALLHSYIRVLRHYYAEHAAAAAHQRVPADRFAREIVAFVRLFTRGGVAPEEPCLNRRGTGASPVPYADAKNLCLERRYDRMAKLADTTP